MASVLICCCIIERYERIDYLQIDESPRNIINALSIFALMRLTLPHLIIEYSENLENTIDMAGLVDAMHATAVTLDPLPTGGIRTRSVARRDFRIADGHRDNGFISVVLRIAKGRSDDEKQAVGEALFSTLTGYVERAFDMGPMSLALEIQEIDPETRWKQSNIREYMEKRCGTGSG